MTRLVRSLSLTACSLLLTLAATNANALTPEQEAIVKKYKISASDQKKLFASAPVAAGNPSIAGPAYAGRPTRGNAYNVNPHANRTDNWHSGLLNNTYVWLAGETYKGLGERITNINGGTGALTGSFGGVAGLNNSFGNDEFPIRLQAGASYGVYDFRGRIALIPNSTEKEKHSIYTVGAYMRGDGWSEDWYRRISVGVVYDHLSADNWGVNAGGVSLAQIRGVAGY